MIRYEYGMVNGRVILEEIHDRSFEIRTDPTRREQVTVHREETRARVLTALKRADPHRAVYARASINNIYMCVCTLPYSLFLPLEPRLA